MAQKGDVIFWWLAAFLLGVAAANWNLHFVWLLVLAGAGILFFPSARLGAAGRLLLLLPLMVGFFYFHLFFNLRTATEKLPLAENAVFQGVIYAEPRLTNNSTILHIRLQKPWKGNATVFAEQGRDFRYGDELEIKGLVLRPEDKTSSAVVVRPEMKILARDRGSRLVATLFGIKNGFLSQLQRLLPADASALAGGLTVGDRAGFPPDFKEDMSRSGTTHLVALSGYNIAILVLAVSGVLGRYLKRRWTFVLTTLTVVLFVLLTGAEASIIRAAIMGFLVLLARESGRRYDFLRAVVLAAVLMILPNPALPAGDIGFQLSFLSLLGIAYLEKPILALLERLRRGPGENAWSKNLATTAAAQLAVLPVLMLQFGGFSLTALLANVLILEFVPLTMFLSFLTGAAGFLSFYAGWVLARLTELFLNYSIFIIRLFSAWGLPLPKTILPLPVFVFVYYLLLLGLAGLGQRRAAKI